MTFIPYKVSVGFIFIFVFFCLRLRHYTVRYREKNRKWNYQTCPTSDTVIDNLKPNTVYEFGVQPSSKDGTGEWSKPVIHNVSSGGIEGMFKKWFWSETLQVHAMLAMCGCKHVARNGLEWHWYIQTCSSTEKRGHDILLIVLVYFSMFKYLPFFFLLLLLGQQREGPIFYLSV